MGQRQREKKLYDVFQANGIETQFASADTNGAPSLTELTTAFGAPTTKEPGWIGIFSDTHTGGVMYLVVTNGVKYTYFTGVNAA